MIPLDKDTFEAYMERLYDNQDVCLLLNISKRMLQRYRDNGLKYHTILHKTYYKEKDLHEFIRQYFDGKNVGKCKRNVMKVSVQRMVCYLVMRTKQRILANNLTLYVSFVLS